MKIIHEYDKCIGCGACVSMCPKEWKMGKNGKAELLESKPNPKNGNHEKEVAKIGCNQDAADSCPINIIHIEK